MIPRTPAILAAFIFIASCNNSEKVELIPAPGEPKLNLSLPVYYETFKIKPATIHGVWRVEGTFMYSNVLEIKKDGTFIFYDRSCLGNSYSEGTWQASGYSYVLKSFDKFKQPTDIYNRDSIPYYFNNEQYRLYGDTLYSYTEKGLVGLKYIMVAQY